MNKSIGVVFLTASIIFFSLWACGDDSGTDADKIGIAGECNVTSDCNQDLDSLVCLTEFSGGYCGLSGCDSTADCPEGSACVNQNGVGYCFRACSEKSECNINRPNSEANCSSTFSTMKENDTLPTGYTKVCTPPSGN